MKIFHQSVFDRWPLEDGCIQVICTSPPYYALRKYSIPDVIIGGNKDCMHEWGDIQTIKSSGGKGYKQDTNKGAWFDAQNSFCIHCHAWQGQYGMEKIYSDYIAHTRLWAKEVWRVLRDDGIFFLNLADSYHGSGKAEGCNNTGKLGMPIELMPSGKDFKGSHYKDKCRYMIPERVAMGLIDDGWILRNHIIWYKPNGMPESCQDRFSKKWESIFMFTKQEKYYFDLGSVKEPLKETTIQRIKYLHGQSGDKHGELRKISGKPQGDYSHLKDKNPSDVWNPPADDPASELWTIPTQASSERHYAMWPQSLVRRMILCSTKEGDAVLDPFCGSGTTLRVADELNRIAYGIDLGYEDIQNRKLSEIQKVLIGVE